MAFLEKLLRSKVFVWAVIILPGLWPVWPLFIQPNSSVLADPLRYVLHHLGFVACLLLVAVLTFSPLRILFPRSTIPPALNRHRRLVGVSAFAYALLHFTTQVLYVYDGTFATLTSELKKPFQLTGLVALAILFVLAVTSVNAMVRWLGGKRWKNLHRLAYVAAALVAYHQAIARKIFPPQVLWIFVPLLALEVARVVKQRRKRLAPRPAPRPTPV